MDLYSTHRRMPSSVHHHHSHHSTGAFLLPISSMHIPTGGSPFPPFDPSSLTASHLDPNKYFPSLHHAASSASIFDPFGNGMFLAAQHHHQPSAFIPIPSGPPHSSNFPPLGNNNNNVLMPAATSPTRSSTLQQHTPTPSAFAPTKLTVKTDNPHQAAATGAIRLAKEDEVTSSAEDIQVVVERPPPTTPHNNKSPDADSDELSFDGEALFESAAKLLFLAVKWAKSMPSFSQIPLTDQTLLLEESWSELFVVTAAQHGLAFESERIKITLFLQQKK